MASVSYLQKFGRVVLEDEEIAELQKINNYIVDDDSDFDSDAEVFAFGTRRLTEQERVEYQKQIEENTGFDVDVPDEVEDIGVLTTLRDLKEDPFMLADIECCSKSAICFYNSNEGTNFMFVKVIKANSTYGCRLHYITFEATDDGDTGGESHETFQAMVYFRYRESQMIKVKFCRIKPTP